MLTINHVCTNSLGTGHLPYQGMLWVPHPEKLVQGLPLQGGPSQSWPPRPAMLTPLFRQQPLRQEVGWPRP